MSEQASARAAEEVPQVKPYIPADKNIPEMTAKALALGAVLGIVFAGSSVYLALKVGMTVSASIPIAVLSITLFRTFGATILENNIAQTTGSAGESIAFAVATVPPALLLMGFSMDPLLVMLVATLGGLLGILMMIPLRRGLIVKEHGKLMYPEGTACAEVLIVGEKGGTDAKMVFTGFGVGVLYKFLNVGLHLWREVPESLLYWTRRLSASEILHNVASGRPAGARTGVGGYNGGSMSGEISPELLGVGYIIGPRVAGITVAGGVLSYLVLIPAIKFFGEYIGAPVFPATDTIASMSPEDVRGNYILYIGAGAVTMGGLVSLVRAMPSIANAFRSGLKDLFGGRAMATHGDRTDRDMPMSVVIVGSIVLALVLWLAPPLHLNLMGALLMIVFGFIFVTVSSRITGEIGSSSNPISGMTISAVLLTCLIFLALGWTATWARAAVISVGAVVCVASSNGGTTSQDLKTGYLLGATPWKQQIAITVGALTSALAVGWILLFLNTAYTTIVPKSYPDVRIENASAGYMQLDVDEHGNVQDSRSVDHAGSTEGRHPIFEVRYLQELRGHTHAGQYLTDSRGQIRYVVDPGIGGTETEVVRGGRRVHVEKLAAPKARLMSLIVDGIMTRKLPWGLVLLGVFISLTLELCGVSSLPFAVGVYLPLSTTTTIFVGGAIRWLIDRRNKDQSMAEAESSPGVLLSSGYIAGGAICGVVLAVLAAKGWNSALDFSDAGSWIGTKLGLGPGAAAFFQNNYWAVFAFAVLSAFLYWTATRDKPQKA